MKHLFIYEFFYLVAPLFVIEFLHRIMDVFEDYFGECTETSLKDNYVIVYEVKYFFLCVILKNFLLLIVIG
jgi:hypothetical protein